MLLLLGAGPQTARAGLLQPLLDLLRPRLETHLTQSCTALVSEGTQGLGQGFSTLAKQPCRSLAKPVSACLIREAGRTGRELGVLTELLRGRIGDDSEVVIQRCVTSLIGLPTTELNPGLLQTLLERLRR